MNQSVHFAKIENQDEQHENFFEFIPIQKGFKNCRRNDYAYWKKWIDKILAFLLFIMIFPLLLIISSIILCSIGRPIIFRQKRIGIHGNIFTIYKFNKMKSNANGEGLLLSEERRITRFGRFLRNSSFDELPQLWNIMNGEMSFVGPRPILIGDLVYLSEEQKKRFSVLPGLTGLAQINGRNSLLWEDKFKFDLDYIQNISFRRDLIISLKTILCVIQHKNVNHDINRIRFANPIE